IVPSGTVMFPGFAGSASVKSQVISLVKRHYEPFNVEVVTSRPTSGDYAMIVASGTSALLGLPSTVGGIAPLDCGDRRANDVSFAFANQLPTAQTIAVTITQESAHSFGAEHTDDPIDVMYPILRSSQNEFTNRINNIGVIIGGMVSPGTSICRPGTTTQNSYDLMLNTLGPTADTIPPMISVMRPANNERVPAGFIVEFNA